MKKLLTYLVLVVSLFLSATNAFAQYGQPSVSYAISINKLIGNPYPINKGGTVSCDWSVSYSDNFLPSDVAKRFKPGQYVCFQLKVKNTSDAAVSDVQVKDTFPSFVTFIAGPGTYDSASGMLSFAAGDFTQNEEKVYFIIAQISDTKFLPSDKGLFCLSNKAEVWGSNSTYDNDFAQFCIEKQVMGVVTTPSAGPELGLILLTGETIALGIGIYLKKLKINV